VVIEPARPDRIAPKIRITASEIDMISIRIARSGYFGGDPAQVRAASIDDVFRVLEYENFLSEYEFTEYKLNENK
jgi:hypothetical protein